MTGASERRRTAVLLDEQPIWLEAVDRVLQRIGIDAAGKTTSRDEALRLLEHRQPDVFVTELVADRDGADRGALLRAAHERVPGLKVIVVSEHEDEASIADAFAAGAGAYVAKRSHPDDLASAIRQAFGHSIYLAWRPDGGNGTRGSGVPLTRREQEILRLAAVGLSNAEIAKTLWVTEQTVKFHLSNVYRKLDVTNRTEASRWAQLNGLLPMDVPARTAPLDAA